MLVKILFFYFLPIIILGIMDMLDNKIHSYPYLSWYLYIPIFNWFYIFIILHNTHKI